MNCVKCNDLGWVCEKHSDKPQGHRTDEPDYAEYCPCAGRACDCEAFPHKKEISENEIDKASDHYVDNILCGESIDEQRAFYAFQAGVQWALERLKGKT